MATSDDYARRAGVSRTVWQGRFARVAFAASLTVVDSMIRVNTAAGPAWYRYNHDTYGDAANGAPWDNTVLQGTGHPWPVLGAERGEYDLSLGEVTQAMATLQTMQRFATPTGLLPEQIWEGKAVPPPLPARRRSAPPSVWCGTRRMARSHRSTGPWDNTCACSWTSNRERCSISRPSLAIAM